MPPRQTLTDAEIDALVHARHPPEAVLAAARWPEASEPVLLIGHQPTLGQVAALLLSGQAQPWAVRKGAVWWLRSRDREGSAQVVLHAVMGPDGL